MTDDELLCENDALRVRVRNLTTEIDSLREVERAARGLRAADECANFSPGTRFNCYVEPEDGWAVRLDPCLFCALDATHRPPLSGET